MNNVNICKRCNKEYDNKMKARRICQECFKEQRHRYYENNRDKFPSKYVKTNKPRGRPKKEKATEPIKEIAEPIKEKSIEPLTIIREINIIKKL